MNTSLLVAPVQGGPTQRTLQEVEQRMQELHSNLGICFVSGYLSEPVAFRSLSVNSADAKRIHSVSVRPC